MEFMIGQLVKSKAGHDKGKLYVVVKKEMTLSGEKLFVSDGINKKVSAPKAKNPLHLQIINRVLKEELTDENIQRFTEVIYGGDN